MRIALSLAALAACSSRVRPPAEAARADAADAAPPPDAAIAAPDAAIAAAPPVRAIGVGEHLSCALLESGDVRCWGATLLTAAPIATTPVSVGIADGVSLAVGTDHVCVARAGGSVWCWGDNRDGALGDGTTIGRGTPAQVPGLTDVVEVVAGGHHSCARDARGAVWCWGDAGTVGHSAARPASSPARVAGLTAATHLFAGDDVTCALVDGGPPRCWGFNTAMLLGSVPGPVLRAIASPPLTYATVFGLGYRTVCLVQADGVLYCAGDDHAGQLGDQRVPDDAQCDDDANVVTCTWTDPPPPRYVPAPGEPPPPDVWPPPPVPQPARHTKTFPSRSGFVHPDLDGRAVALAGALTRTCAINELGAVWCWGQMYHGSMEWSHRTPRAIPGVDHAIAIAVAHEHACALLADHTVRCWGYDRAGELGDGRATRDLVVSPEATPVRW